MKFSKRISDKEQDRLAATGIGGALLGAALGGPVGVLVGGAIGLFLGHAKNEEEKSQGTTNE
ncbi:MAG: hypothetical protein GY839_21440 [candidate division Zixibacteria bacterium]|nr:hypothetical protein [candidate division Zixibacteria bacterium]